MVYTVSILYNTRVGMICPRLNCRLNLTNIKLKIKKLFHAGTVLYRINLNETFLSGLCGPRIQRDNSVLEREMISSYFGLFNLVYKS